MAGETILIVDDEPTIRDLATIVLKSQGYNVLTAQDGLEGMAVFENKADAISLLLTDVQMPKLDGLKLAFAVRSIKPDLNVIFMSGYAPTTGITKAVEEWKAQFMPKPFTLDRLNTFVHR